MFSLRLLRGPDVDSKRGTSKSTRYEDVSNGLLTPPIRLGARSVGWPEHEVDTLIKARIAGRTDDEIRKLVKDLIIARGAEPNKDHATREKREKFREMGRRSGAKRRELSINEAISK